MAVYDAPLRAMVTGCNGFLGSTLCARLTEIGVDVIGIDNNCRGLNVVKDLPNLVYHEFDLQSIITRRQILELNRPDVIFHLAAATGDLTRPVEELEAINVQMTYDLFKDSRTLTPMDSYSPIFIYPTTSLAIAVPESTYVQTKEKVLDMLRGEPDSDRLILFRNFNICGSYRDFGENRRMEVHLFPRMYKCYKTGETLTINGDDYDTIDGTPSRDFAHVLDAMDFYIHCWILKRSGRLDYPTTDGLLEMGRGKPITVLECAQIVLENMKKWGIRGPGFNMEIGPRRDYDCGSLRCSRPDVVSNFREPANWYQMLRDSMLGYENFFQKTGRFFMKEDGEEGRMYYMDKLGKAVLDE
jgi:UDP-glucose 4-epimerase